MPAARSPSPEGGGGAAQAASDGGGRTGRQGEEAGGTEQGPGGEGGRRAGRSGEGGLDRTQVYEGNDHTGAGVGAGVGVGVGAGVGVGLGVGGTRWNVLGNEPEKLEGSPSQAKKCQELQHQAGPSMRWPEIVD